MHNNDEHNDELIKLDNRFFFTMLLQVAPLAGCTSTFIQESTGKNIDNRVITSAVKGELYSDPDFKVGQINVETYKVVVHLSGLTLPKLPQKLWAWRISHKGVRSDKK